MNLSELDNGNAAYERFVRRIGVLANGCWSVGALGKYAKFRLGTRSTDPTLGNHRYSYLIHKGEIPPGLQIDHLCREKSCCNPDHLEAVTPSENSRRGGNVERGRNRDVREMQALGRAAIVAKAAKRRHCKRGHEYSPANTYSYKGARICRACLRFNHHRRRSLAR